MQVAGRCYSTNLTGELSRIGEQLRVFSSLRARELGGSQPFGSLVFKLFRV